MRILVTGGAGFIGSHTVVTLLQDGHEVAVLDNFSNSNASVLENIKNITGKNPEFFFADVRNFDALIKVFNQFHPQVVIHFAGLKSVEESVREPLRYFDWNVSGSINLFKVMEETGVTSLIFSSTAAVYGESDEVPIKENSAIAPSSPYGRSKAMIEQIIADLGFANPVWRIICLRYFNPVGAHESGLIGESPKGIPSNLIPYISLVALGECEELKIFGGDYPTVDGTGVRDYIHVMDLARGHLAALNFIQSHTGVHTVNLGTGRGYSVLEILKEFEKVTSRKIPYQIVERRLGDVAQSFADTSLANNLLMWRTEYGIDTMCRDAWRWQLMQAEISGRA